MSARALLFVAAIAALPIGCERPRFSAGEGCEINSDCADPLVCVLEACRRQCVDSRDCGAGLRCLGADESSLGGGCQLAEEASCAVAADCMNEGLVCQSGTCTRPCRADRDCVSGQRCQDNDGVVACYEAIATLCLYHSDCPAPMICDEEQRCRLECIEDRDCTIPRSCVANLCELPPALLGDGGS